jgi:hypothetical protein
MPNNVIFNDDGSGGQLVKAKQKIKDSLNKDFEDNAKKIEDETKVTKNIKIKVETNVKSNLDELAGES